MGLEKNWFGPVGRLLDLRDTKIRDSLNTARKGSKEFEIQQKEAEALVKSAREEGEAKIAEAKAEAFAKSEAKLLAKKSKLNDELKSAAKESESEGIAVEKDIKQQAEDLSEYIIKKVLP